MKFICLFVTIGVFILASVGCQASDTEEWRLVFGLKGEKLTPDKTLELLKKIKENLPDDYQVKDLLEANDVHNYRKCTVKTFEFIDSLIRANAAYTRSVVPYLVQCRENAFGFCKRTLEQDLRHDIENFPEMVLPDMTLFREKVFAVGPIEKAHQFIPQENIEEGTSSFMSVQAPEFMNKIHNHSLEEFSEKLEEFVGRLCMEVEEAYPSRYTMALLQYDNATFFRRLDDKTKEWLTNIKICAYVTSNMRTLTTNIYNKLISGNQ